MRKETWNAFSIHFTFFRSVYDISAFLSASWPHPCLDAARYACDSDAANLLETNANLTQILTSDLGLTVA